MAAAGLALPLCGACNALKTANDAAGVAVWRHVRWGRSQFRPIGYLPKESPPAVEYPMQVDKRDTGAKKSLIPTSERAFALAQLALGMTRSCMHPRGIVRVAYSPAERSIYFDCPLCPVTGVVLGTLAGVLPHASSRSRKLQRQY